MKTQVKNVFEGKDKNKVNLGELVGESVVGRLSDIITKFGPEFVESLVDTQLLHHQFTTAFKAKPSKEGDDKYGVDRLPTEPTEGRQLWFDTYGVIRVNWAFRPGEGKGSAEKQARYDAALKEQVDMLCKALGVDVLPDAVMANAKEVVRKAVYGSK